MPGHWPKIVSILLQQILVLSVFVLLVWFLPDNYIEKSVTGRCALNYQQLQPALLPSSTDAEKSTGLKLDQGAYKFSLKNTSCAAINEPILVVETLWLHKISATQITPEGNLSNLHEANIGGRFFNYSLNNSIDLIELTMTPVLDLQLTFSIWEKQDYQVAVQKLNIYFALLFSAFCTLLIFNILIYLQSQDEDYRHYLPFLLSQVAFLALSEGLFQSLGWRPSDFFISPLWWFAALSGYFSIRFIMPFSGMEQYFPRFTKFAVIYPSYFMLVGAIISLFHLATGSLIIRFLLLWLTIVPWLALLKMLKTNAFGTAYMFIAWTALIVGVFLRTLYGFEFIELSRLVIYGVVIGSLLQTLLLSLILGYKMELFRKGQEFHLNQSMTDTLTGLPNRRYLDEIGAENFLKFTEHQHSVAVAVIDCDHFKDVNDNYGHETGDYVLNVISRKIRTALKENDIVGRWGGDEFLCIFPNITEEILNAIMLRLLDSISANSIHIQEKSIHTGVSIGLTFVNKEDTSINDAIRRADRALFQAKQAGRAQLIHI